jgi:hypothetical protein
MTIRSTLAVTLTTALWFHAAACTYNDAGDDDSGDTGGDGDGGDGGDGGDRDGGGDPGGDADPRSGSWGYAEYAPNRNDCNLDPSYGNGGGRFALDNHGDGSFTVVPSDGTDPFDCTLDGASFACPDRATEAEQLDGDYDATLIGHAVADGVFATDESGSGTQTATISCAGSDCALAEAALGVDFPCTLEVDFVIEYLGS